MSKLVQFVNALTEKYFHFVQQRIQQEVRTVWRLDSLEAGQSGGWTVWRLDSLEAGQSGGWTVWRLDSLEAGQSGGWTVS